MVLGVSCVGSTAMWTKRVTSEDISNGKPWGGGRQTARRSDQPSRQGASDLPPAQPAGADPAGLAGLLAADRGDRGGARHGLGLRRPAGGGGGGQRGSVRRGGAARR